jgi:hypothetical protein
MSYRNVEATIKVGLSQNSFNYSFMVCIISSDKNGLLGAQVIYAQVFQIL